LNKEIIVAICLMIAAGVTALLKGLGTRRTLREHGETLREHEKRLRLYERKSDSGEVRIKSITAMLEKIEKSIFTNRKETREDIASLTETINNFIIKLNHDN